jgi:hypothetical protein
LAVVATVVLRVVLEVLAVDVEAVASVVLVVVVVPVAASVVRDSKHIQKRHFHNG